MRWLDSITDSMDMNLSKLLETVQETWVRFLGRKDPLEKEMATHSSIPAWRIPMDRGAWQATVYGVTKSQMRLSTAQHSVAYPEIVL